MTETKFSSQLKQPGTRNQIRFNSDQLRPERAWSELSAEACCSACALLFVCCASFCIIIPLTTVHYTAELQESRDPSDNRPKSA
jgi:hypothetical protein